MLRRSLKLKSLHKGFPTQPGNAEEVPKKELVGKILTRNFKNCRRISDEKSQSNLLIRMRVLSVSTAMKAC